MSSQAPLSSFFQSVLLPVVSADSFAITMDNARSHASAPLSSSSSSTNTTSLVNCRARHGAKRHKCRACNGKKKSVSRWDSWPGPVAAPATPSASTTTKTAAVPKPTLQKSSLRRSSSCPTEVLGTTAAAPPRRPQRQRSFTRLDFTSWEEAATNAGVSSALAMGRRLPCNANHHHGCDDAANAQPFGIKGMFPVSA